MQSTINNCVTNDCIAKREMSEGVQLRPDFNNVRSALWQIHVVVSLEALFRQEVM